MNMKFALLSAASIAFAATAYAHSNDGGARMMVGANVVAPCEISSDSPRRSMGAARISVTCANPRLSYHAAQSPNRQDLAIASPLPRREGAIEPVSGHQYAIEEILF
jgi:hypothetical protein